MSITPPRRFRERTGEARRVRSWTRIAAALLLACASVLGARTALAVAFGPVIDIVTGLPFVTVVEFGPEDPDPLSDADGCLYVGLGKTGEIRRICLDAAKTVTSNEIVASVFQCNALLGVVIDPDSDPAGEIHLYVAYSFYGAPFRGRIARAVSTDGGLSFTVTPEFITGLGRSVYDHQTNGLGFGPDGCLYIAQGNNSNLGYDPSHAESRLSSAMLRACFKTADGSVDPTFDGDCGEGNTQQACDVEVYASGLRNPFDLVWHANGRLYSTDNDANGGGAWDDCHGPANDFGCACESTPVEPVGDELNVIEPGRYYGNPNPYLANPSGLQCNGGTDGSDACTSNADCGGGGSCVDLSSLCTDATCGDPSQCFYFGDAHGPEPGEDPNGLYQPPIAQVGNMTGLTEYRARFDGRTSSSFCSDWNGDLLTAGAPGDLQRLDLSSDGLSATYEGVANLNGASGLDVTVGHDGTIYFTDLLEGKVSYLRPIPQSDPAAVDYFASCAVGDACTDGVCRADTDQDGLGEGLDPCPTDALNRCAGPVAIDGGSGIPIRINAGTLAETCAGTKVDCNGDTWSADFGYNLSGAASLACDLPGGCPADATAIFGCTDAATEAIFRCEHADAPPLPELLYSFDVPDGPYVVNLLFMNTSTATTAPGSRLFDVRIEGATAHAGFDPVEAAGGSSAPVVRSAVVTVSDGDGLQIEFDHQVPGNPSVEGIEVLQLVLAPVCSIDPDCDDGDVCTADVCNVGVCENDFDPGLCLNAFPAGDDFEAGFGGWSDIGGDDLDWTRHSGPTPTAGTGPPGDNTSGSGFFLYTEASGGGSPGMTALLEGPCVELSGMAQATWRFWYHMQGAGMGSLHADVAPGCGTTWISILDLAGEQGSSWLRADLDLATWLGQRVRLRFRGVTGSDERSDMAVDDVSIDASPNPPNTVPTEIQMPGTQPNELANDIASDTCAGCHSGYSPTERLAEPQHGWGGSMMAHSGRDPLFWAALAVAEQDIEGSGDLCLRCHVPKGWLAGRSQPTDGSGLLDSDAEGVGCDLCHRLTNPDGSEHVGVQNPPFLAHDGGSPAEPFVGTGMYVVWDQGSKLGPYADSSPPHGALTSQLHRSSDLCGTCHDVSNPLVGDLAHNNGAQVPLSPGSFSGVQGAPVEEKAAFLNLPHEYGVVERTYSEFRAGLLSQTPIGDFPTLPADLRAGSIRAAYDAALLAGNGGDYSDGTPRTFSCQSCHMRPLVGAGCNSQAAPNRTDLPSHDLTGGNYWAADAIAYLDGLGKLRLGGGLADSELDQLDAGKLRARQSLNDSARLEVIGNTLRVVNLTGHKLITGYPEGRRIWLHVEWFDEPGTLVDEAGAYGPITAQIDGVPTAVETLLDPEDPDLRSYVVHNAITQEWASELLGMGLSSALPLTFDRVTGAVTETLGGLAAQAPGSWAETQYFVLNNHVAGDTRIPPWGMSYDEAATRNALPVPPTQYGDPGPGGTYDYWDEMNLVPPPGARRATITLLYQPTSWEYVQFLYLSNRGENPFLAQEGQNLLDAWLATGMAAPHAIASTTWTDLTDTTAPSVSLSAPTPGVLSGQVMLGATASDDIGVVGVQFLLDGSPLGPEDLAAPYELPWNTLVETDGAYVLSALARDAAGNSTVAPDVAVTVSNIVDTTAPTVSLTAPAPGTVSGQVTLQAAASDDVGVVGVQFLLDGSPLGPEDMTEPYALLWDTLAELDGAFVLSARARDPAGNTGSAGDVAVTVSNAAQQYPAVAAWPFDEGSGLVAVDFSGNGHDGALTGAAWTSEGRFGGALEFDGVDDMVLVPDDDALDLGDALTISAWVYPAPGNSGWSPIVQKQPDAFWLDATSPSGKPAAGGETASGCCVAVYGASNLPVDTWSHLAMTYDGAELALYVDGALVSTKPLIGSFQPTTGDLRIGRGNHPASAFAGRIDEIRIHDRVLTEAEIAAAMATPISAGGPIVVPGLAPGLIGLLGALMAASGCRRMRAQSAGR